MPRRSSTRATALVQPISPNPSPAPQPSSSSEELFILRTQWKWAAFSQFFFTFSQLFNMDDVSLTDIEDDLVRGSNVFLPRVMARLLYTLSYDRKVSLDNWQTALRKQHNRRDPLSNPIGPEPTPDYEDMRASSPAADHDLHMDLAADQAELAASPSPKSEGTAPPDSPGTKEENDSTSRPKSPLGQPEETQEATEREESRDWLDLPMLVKLDSMHLLTEWQFQNPTRLRTLMKSDDETATWRIEPIGYDSKHNAYWLIGADRIWIQRPLPKPSKPAAPSLKRKRAREPSGPKRFNGSSSKRAKHETNAGERTGKSKQRAKSKVRKVVDAPLKISIPSTGGRAAKAQAKVKLDMQARELAELNRQAAMESSGSMRASKRQKTTNSSAGPAFHSRPLGTRLSARLRGPDAEEWQPVPEEWLKEDGDAGEDETEVAGSPIDEKAGKGVQGPKTGLESDEDSISDLTELSEESEAKFLGKGGAEDTVKTESQPDLESEHARERPTDDRGLEIPSPLPEGFVEWETICVTLYEWEHIAERFEKGTHYTEKHLHKVLVNTIVPVVTEELQEIDRKRRLEEAIVHRKRSSRIAIKESEREEARLAARKKTEETEKMSRAQRLEARLAKEEADRERRELAREQRRKEREAKEALSKSEEDIESPEVQIDVVGDIPVPNQKGLPTGTTTFHQGKVRYSGAFPSTNGSGTRTPAGDDWELNCEICRRNGINLDDGTPMMCCGSCSQWQHIACHDRADIQAGRPLRNWDLVDFFCRQCRFRRAPTATTFHPSSHQQQHISQSSTYAPPAPSMSKHYGQFQAYHPSQPSSSDHTGERSYLASINPLEKPATVAVQPQSFTAAATQHHERHENSPSYQAPQRHTYTSPSSEVQRPSFTSQQSEVVPNGLSERSYQPSVANSRGWNVTTSVQPHGYAGLQSSYSSVPVSNGGGAHKQHEQYRHLYNETTDRAANSWRAANGPSPAPSQQGFEPNPFRYAAPYQSPS